LQPGSQHDGDSKQRHLEIKGGIEKRTSRLTDDQQASGGQEDEQDRPDGWQEATRDFGHGHVALEQPPDPKIHEDRGGKDHGNAENVNRLKGWNNPAGRLDCLAERSRRQPLAKFA
jgi:hypothetical protein